MSERILSPARNERARRPLQATCWPARAWLALALAVVLLQRAVALFPDTMTDQLRRPALPRFADPQLQSSPRLDMDEFRAATAARPERAPIGSTRQHGVVHLPIDDAMRKLAAGGHPGLAGAEAGGPMRLAAGPAAARPDAPAALGAGQRRFRLRSQARRTSCRQTRCCATSRGGPVTLGSVIGGAPLILALGYFHCPNLCGVVRDDVLSALERAGLRAGTDYRLLVLSIDPDETPGGRRRAPRRARCRAIRTRRRAATGAS